MKGNYKLTVDQVRAIKVALREGKTQSALAREFKVTRANVNLIANNQTWQHVEV